MAALLLMGAGACSSGDDLFEPSAGEEAPREVKTCLLILDATLGNYPDEVSTRADGDWKSGDKIYLYFSGSAYGSAVYDGGAWLLSYSGTLPKGEASTCTAIYFDNPLYESGTMVSLSANTAIYEAADATYSYDGNSLSVMAELKPKTGRIRFAGKEDEEITVFGITYQASYDSSLNRYVETEKAVRLKVSGGYTPYIYGLFSDEEQPRLNVISATSGYTRFPSNTIFRKGESGYMTLPSPGAAGAWQNFVAFKINGVEFMMIPVEYDKGNFLMAETETTEELYAAITGSGDRTQYPKRGISWEKWSEFLDRLEDLTALDFRMPAVEEWEFAAKGGNRNQGFTYAGSNIIDDVAWYSSNSDFTSHPVKEKQPNELGFYDMSGNVSEATSTRWSTGSSYMYWCGGYYGDGASNCTVTSKKDYASSSNNSGGGLRITLSNR